MEKDEDARDFRARLRTLQNVAIEISSVLEEQNKSLEEKDTLLRRTVKRIGASLDRMNQISSTRFSANLYLVLAALALGGLFYILFLVL